MAVITDGVTEVDLGDSMENVVPTIEKTSKVTAGGNIRSITAGERFKMNVEARVSDTTLRSFFTLLKNGASNYFFTPTTESEWTNSFSNISFPLNCNIYSIERKWDKRDIYYLSFIVESVSYV